MIKKFDEFLNENENLSEEKTLTWKKYKAESGETWEKSKEFVRLMDWVTGDLQNKYKELAKILGVPEELFVADRVTFKMVAERNLDTTADSSPVNQPEMKKYF